MWKWIALGVVVVAVVAAVYVEATEAVPVEVAQAAKGEISAYIEERAQTTLPRVYHVTMPLSGRVLPSTLEEGTPVEQGRTVVARLDAADLKTALAAATARRDGAAAEIEVNKYNALEETAKIEADSILEAIANAVSASAKKAEASRERRDFALTRYRAAQKAYDRKAATELELQQAQAEYAEEQVNYQADKFIEYAMKAFQTASKLMPIYIDQYLTRKSLDRKVLIQRKAEAQADLDRAQRDLHRTEILSPVTGVVLKRHVINERVLSAGAPLLDLGKLEELEVTAEVLSQEAVQIRPGNPVEIFGAAIGAEPIDGRVKRVNPAGFTKVSSLGVEQQRVAVIISIEPQARAALKAAGRKLGVGYRVRVRIHTDTAAGAVKVPRTALFRGHGGQWEVFAVRNGRARRTKVTIGLTNDREAQVTDGLSSGDLVVLAPEATLRSGNRVSYETP